MSAVATVAAVDLGAESGRVVRADFDGERLAVREVSRFPHTPFVVDGILRWDLDLLTRAITDGLGTLAAEGSPVASVGVDAWGVDYGLLAADGTLVDLPTCYRDPRQLAAMDEALAMVGRERLYRATGVQLNEINTVFALMSDARTTTRLDRAATLLMLPDVVHSLLAGSRVTEATAASTSGLYDVAAGRWVTELADDLGIPTRLLPEVVPPGTDLGPLLGPLGDGPLAGTRVIAPAGHDTASAVVATPFPEPGALFISSGTWSLVGVELPRPVVTPASLAANLTNEGGYAGTTRLLRNVMGLWLLQECRRAWAAQGREFSYAELTELAGREPALRCLVNPNARDFLARGDMPARVQEYCRRTGQPVPESPGAIARCVVDSLAVSYRVTAEDIAAVTGTAPTAVCVTGGGARSALLAQATADATGLPVHCGPVEATSLGNAAAQLVALGELGGVTDTRAVVARTADLHTCSPRPDARWEQAAALLRERTQDDDRQRGLIPT
ncbi:rhamnulokinase [Geodermatophilus sabuli]|uniref:Rhamnulokinase n=1 Tax=Geodermatophilus sabuli TaxID=1564158 RepID=A0A285EJL8_9ACTN|nr:rhamnulokinase family protein [Geodermatophilus sabuli]MBB3083816.1 rhamnulokinase [Geodermatophilus sabuli]SNX99329.1 rhamnulokinase [Geodermatophilus sabuli]